MDIMVGVTDQQASMMAKNLGFDGPKEKQVWWWLFFVSKTEKMLFV